VKYCPLHLNNNCIYVKSVYKPILAVCQKMYYDFLFVIPYCFYSIRFYIFTLKPIYFPIRMDIYAEFFITFIFAQTYKFD